MEINKTNLSYLKALADLHDAPEVSPRGMKVKEILAYKFLPMDPKCKLITIPEFETHESYAKEELRWYYAATDRIDFSPVIEKTWRKFSDNGLHVNSAYGFRIFGKDPRIGINQWEWAIEKLKEDKDTRQALINVNSAYDKFNPTKDFVCTVSLQVFIRNNALHWITHMRSQDVFYGTRNDIYCFMAMQERMAQELGIPVGDYIHICNSLHIYEQHFEKLKKLVNENKDLIKSINAN